MCILCVLYELISYAKYWNCDVICIVTRTSRRPGAIPTPESESKDDSDSDSGIGVGIICS